MGWKDAPQEAASPSWASAPAEQTAPASASAPAARIAGTPEQNRQKFLNFLGQAEAADYDVIVGGKRFTDFSRHPGVTGVVTGDGPSTAAGKYQITGTTYRDVAPKIGVTDFSKKSQDSIALELIRRKGALADVDSGNWEGAITKLGGTWASLPSSPYNQPKKSMAWSLAVLNGQPPPLGDAAAPSGYASAPRSGYKPFAQVRQNIDPKSLNTDPSWLAASALLYELWERKAPTDKSPSDLAEWGKDRLGYFNFNTIDMARIANQVRQGTQEQKEAFLYMLDTYDNTNMSWEGAGRAAKGIFTDPLNLVGLGTFGVGFGAKMAARTAAKEAAKEVVKRSMLEVTKDAIVTGAARTGVVAGMEGAIYGGAQSAIKQGVEVSAGRRDSISVGKVAADSALGAGAGFIGGTTLDVVASKALPPAADAVNNIKEMFKGKAKEAPKPRVDPTMDPLNAQGAPVVDPVVTPQTPTAATTSAKAQDIPAGVDLYHGTKAQDITVEQLSVTKDLGPHFSTARDTATLFSDDGGTAGKVLEAKGRFEKSIELPDLNGWYPTNVAEAIDVKLGNKAGPDGQTPLQAKVWDIMEAAKNKFLDEQPADVQDLRNRFLELSPEEKLKWQEVVAEASDAANEAGYEAIKKELRDQGYDSVLYKNMNEGNPVDTYIALDMSKVSGKDAAAAPAKNLPITENKSGEKFYDTRGSGERFHGSSNEISKISDDQAMSGDSRNIYGQGFYTTDAADISNGYMKKGKGGSPTLYKIEEVNNPKMYDMEAPLSESLKKDAEEIFGDLYRTENGETGKPINNLRELFDEVRAESRYEGYSRDDVQELFDALRTTLEQQGYNGYQHIGGAGTGNKAHDVKIYWTPEQHTKSTKVDIKEYKPGAPTPANSNLTPDEILAAKARQQDGRLPADEVAPDMSGAGSAASAEVPDMKFGDTKKFVLRDGTKITVEKVVDDAAGTAPAPGYTPKESDYGAMLVVRDEDGNQIGFLAYLPGSPDIQSKVDDAFQRKGIGTLLYDIAEKHGADFSEDPRVLGLVSEDAIKLREARSARGAGDVMGGAKLVQKADEPLVKLPDVENTGGRTTRVNGEDVAKVTKADVEAQAKPIMDQLKALSDEDLPVALEQLRTGKFTMEEQRVIATALRLHSDELAVAAKEAVVARDALLGKANRTPEEELKLEELTKQADALLARWSTPNLADDAYGSMAGTMLNDRRQGGPGASKITVESIMAEKGVTRDEALTIWAEVIAKAEQDAAVQKVVDDYEVKIQAAMEAGDTELAIKLAVQKRREIAGMVEEVTPGSAGVVDKLKELAISNVFSPTTVQVNLFSSSIKAFITPAMKFIFSNPAEKAARAELAASYSAMKSSFGSAFRSAMTAYRMEQALLTRDGTRLVEGELALQGWIAGKVRFFPRVLNASDEFLSRITYDSYVAGKAAADAAIEGAEKGLKGKDLDAFIKDASQAALEGSRNVTNGDDLVQPIINKGVNLGLSGDDLYKFVENEALRNPDAFRKGTDEEALAYVRDVLYKRDFSGNGSASKLAQLYEKGAKAVPAWALVTGQLFFRTPIRVFEEGIRLTPGLQIIAPNFLADLAGKNGTARQVKAQAESMTSLAVAGAVLSLYSQGRITGDGAYSDFKQQRNRVDGPLQAPYTIMGSDGGTWSYKLFDPISTPVKIMVNALERADRLRLKQSQGEDIPESKIEEAYSHVSVGVAAVLTAIKDANLVSGARMTAEIFTNAEDIEKNEDKFLKLLGEKMFLLVPNTLHKIAKDHDPSIRDPKDFWQMVDDKLARSLGAEVPGVKTAMAYDILGNVRKPADTGSLWNIFSVSTAEERTKGMSDAEQTILAETDRLSRVMGATFKAPTTHKSMGDLDFRTLVTKDGTKTLYDVWQEKYKALLPVEDLATLITSEIPEGTFKYKEGKATVIQNFIGQIQEAAFRQLQEEEGDVINAEIDRVVRAKAEARTGLFDSKRPY